LALKCGPPPPLGLSPLTCLLQSSLWFEAPSLHFPFSLIELLGPGRFLVSGLSMDSEALRSSSRRSIPVVLLILLSRVAIAAPPGAPLCCVIVGVGGVSTAGLFVMGRPRFPPAVYQTRPTILQAFPAGMVWVH